MGHLGLTPQSIEKLGGHKVQGKSDDSSKKILDEAAKLEDSGCFAIVLECIPDALAAQITANSTIPTIGIGAGPFTNGQVLVFQDLLGMQKDFKPKFLRHYVSGECIITEAINQFHKDVIQSDFPSIQESYR